MNLALTVVGFDFADDEGEDLDVKMEAGTQEEVYKQENERMLKSIVDSMGDRGDILPAAEMYKDMTVLRRGKQSFGAWLHMDSYAHFQRCLSPVIHLQLARNGQSRPSLRPPGCRSRSARQSRSTRSTWP